ncbi:hypothetical protein CAEBREN_14144 [Caenorhabditis brenneri]|uniref:G-patch domain-containing protein n=1 Tax=Caenorhabditis brenneri TaxID=135651 RepID=G0NED4_CAEBE|nr:hypothetical protein CAEBREN_14144 [Caenorhabditis brenneri]
MNYSLPPQNLGAIDPDKRVDFVRAQNELSTKKPAKSVWETVDPDDIPEVSFTPSTSGFASIYQKILEKSMEKSGVSKKAVKVEEDDDIIILEDAVKKEPVAPKFLDMRDVNGYLKAAKDGNLDEIRRFLRKKIPIDTTDFYGWTATMCAAAEGNFEICKYLLENGADPGARDRNGLGIVQVAQKNRQKEFVRKLFAYFCGSDRPSTSSEPEQLTFCELCNTFIADSNTHISTITHQLNDQKSSGAAPQSGIQIGPSNIGYRLMRASGWTEDQGLGRNSDGSRFPIKTILKRNKTGLGMENLPKKVTHFGPYDRNAIRVDSRPKIRPVTKRDLEVRRRKEDRIARDFRNDFSEFDGVREYFQGK